MKAARTRWLAGAMLVGLGFAACSASVPSSNGTGSTSGTGNTSGTGSTAGTGSMVGTGTGGDGGAVVYPPGGPAPTAVPIRRLTTSEYTEAVNDLFLKRTRSDGTVYAGFTIPSATFVLEPRVFGFVNLSSAQMADQTRMEQYENAARMIATGDTLTPQVWKGVTADPTLLTGCNSATRSELLCAQPYLYDLAARAYRRPLADVEKTNLWNLFLNPAGGTYSQRLALAIEGILMSPNFIFRPELGDSAKVVAPGIVELTPWEMASRLSFFLNRSTPDDLLTASATSGALRNAAEVRAQAQRLLALPRSQSNLVQMHESWLTTYAINGLTKQGIPEFTSLLAGEMGLETRTFVQKVIFDQSGTFNDLMLSPYTFGNGDIAKFYGVPYPGTDPTQWVRLNLNPAQRMGILTQPSLLATLTKDSATQDLGTAIRRGKFVLQQILCRTVASPTPAILAKFPGPLDLTKTTRGQAAVHEVDPVCAGCHAAIDPLGLPFENYDMIGRWRDTDKGMTIDASGQIGDPGTNANPVMFTGVPGLAALVAQRPETRGCYLQQWFLFSTGKLVSTDDLPYLDWLNQTFTSTQKLVDMVVNLVSSDAFRQLKLDPTAGISP